jgi:predicted PurR-regulated permease PerM
MSDSKIQTFHISTLTIIKVIAILLILWFLYLILDVLTIIFASVILAILIDPLADWFEKKKVPRSLAVLLVYLILISLLSLMIALVIPPVISQFHQLIEKLPVYWQKFTETNIGKFIAQQDFKNLKESLESLQANLARGIYVTLGGAFGSAFAFFLVLVLTFYIVTQESALQKTVKSLIPDQYLPYLTQLFLKIKQKMNAWFKGQLILCFAVGFLVYVGLLILRVDYALTLGLIAGVTEIIPYIGPVLGAVPAVFIAFGTSPIKALMVIILYIIIQQLENNLLVPKIMQKAVGLNPIVSIIVLIIGGKLGGVVGALLAIPIASALSIFIQDLKEKSV